MLQTYSLRFHALPHQLIPTLISHKREELKQSSMDQIECYVREFTSGLQTLQQNKLVSMIFNVNDGHTGDWYYLDAEGVHKIPTEVDQSINWGGGNKDKKLCKYCRKYSYHWNMSEDYDTCCSSCGELKLQSERLIHCIDEETDYEVVSRP